MAVAQKSRPMLAAALLAGLLSLAVTIKAHELPPMSKMLELAGLSLESQAAGDVGQLTPEQLKIVEEMSQIYETEDELHDRERALLAKVGVRRPDGAEKGKLQVMYNTHLLSNKRLGELARELRASVEAKKQGQQKPAPAA